MFKFFKNKKLNKKIENTKAIAKEKKIANIEEAISDLAATYDDSSLQTLYSCSVQKTPKDFIVKQYNLDGNLVNVALDSLDDEFSDNASSGNLEEAINDVYQMQKAGQEVIFSYYAKQGFIGFNNCSILAQDWLIQKAIDAPCEDAVAVEYKISSNEKEITDEEKDIMQKMKNVSDDTDGFNIRKVLKRAASNKRKYGQSLVVPLIDEVDYSLPFNIDAVKTKSYKGMAVVEPIWVTPVLDTEAITNPLSKRFYQPTWFKMSNGTLVHYSWVIFNTYGELSDILKPTYYWGGIPLPQLLYEQTYAAHKTAKEAPMLAQSKRLNYAEVNVNSLLFDKEQRKSLKFMSWLRNNFGWLMIKPDQKIGQLDTTLTDFDSITMLSYQVVAAISGVIATRLLETSPKGWQSSGSYEEKQYKNKLKEIQNGDFNPILDLHYRLLAKSEFDLNKRYIIHFEEIDTPTAKEAAEIRQIDANTDAIYIQAGIISADEARAKLREDETSPYNALEEEMPETEGDLFGEEGGSLTKQSPFSLDEWFTVHPNGKENEGRPVYAEGGESKADAIKRRFGETGKGKNLNPQNNTNNENNVKPNNIHKNISETKTSERKNGKGNSQENTNSSISSKEVIKQSANFVNSLNEDEKTAIKVYTDDNEYTKINGYLRGDLKTLNKNNQKTIETLNNIMEKAEIQNDMTLYRGVRPDFVEKALNDKSFKQKFKNTYFEQPTEADIKLMKDHFIGKHFTEKGFMSTSYDKTKALEHEIMLTVRAPKGTKAINVSPLSTHDEAEMLINKGYTCKISDMQIFNSPNGGKRWNFIIDLEKND